MAELDGGGVLCLTPLNSSIERIPFPFAQETDHFPRSPFAAFKTPPFPALFFNPWSKAFRSSRMKKVVEFDADFKLAGEPRVLGAGLPMRGDPCAWNVSSRYLALCDRGYDPAGAHEDSS